MNDILIKTKHKDKILDISFNIYSDRIVTASADNTLMIWNKNKENGEFHHAQTIEDHKGPIFKARWAPPQFGSIIATCCFDRKVRIYEEINTIKGKEWKLKSEWKDEALDIEFGPFMEDFVLAIGTLDGKLKVFQPYSAFNPSNWKQNDDQDINHTGISSISWRKSNFGIRMIAVGCRGDGDNIAICKYSKEKKIIVVFRLKSDSTSSCDIRGVLDLCWAPSNGKSFDTIAICSSQGISLRTFNLNGENISNVQETQLEKTEGSTNVKWHALANLLASSDNNGCLKIWKTSSDRFVSLICELSDKEMEVE